MTELARFDRVVTELVTELEKTMSSPNEGVPRSRALVVKPTPEEAIAALEEILGARVITAKENAILLHRQRIARDQRLRARWRRKR